MMSLITAAPGGGKTAYAVGVLMKEADGQGRPIFQMGIPELLIPHIPVSKLEEWVERRPSVENPDVAYPYFTFPEGALIFIDECQRIFPTRPNGSRVPDHIAAFETHRHTGVDFVLMTQHPQLIDNHVRKLVGRHVHLRDVGFFGRWFYEWPECTDVGQFRSAPVKKKYKLPKGSFGLYKSSSLHIKPTRTLPPALIILAAAIVGMLALGAYFFSGFGSKNSAVAADSKAPAVATSSESGDYLSQDDIKLEFMPRVPDRLETAPIYDALRVARQMPEISGCVIYEAVCSCYTQQGTKAPVSVEYCKAYMAGDRPFNPYAEIPQAVQPQQEHPAPQRGPTVATAPGNPPEWLRPQSRLPVDQAASNHPEASIKPM